MRQPTRAAGEVCKYSFGHRVTAAAKQRKCDINPHPAGSAFHVIRRWPNGYACSDGERPPPDPILGLRGLRKEIRADEDGDAYVRRLREGRGSGSELARGISD